MTDNSEAAATSPASARDEMVVEGTEPAAPAPVDGASEEATTTPPKDDAEAPAVSTDGK